MPVKTPVIRLAVLPLLAVVAACTVGAPAFRIQGEAPAERECRVDVVRTGGTRVLYTHDVSGDFTVTPPPGNLGTSNVDVLAVCDGRTVMKVSDVAPAFYWEKPLQLGDF